ncbi:MAG: glutamate-5-semialdehyde dehydrogenase [Eubacteriaceae bacterium]|jgi:glutamate-5-semialdehyde dehydrogenase
MTENKVTIREKGREARQASLKLSTLPYETRQQALTKIAEKLRANEQMILQANEKDLKRSEQEGLAAPLMKRLRFDDHKLADVIAGIESLKELDNPIGDITMQTELDNGLILSRVTVPLGVLGIIFESRPDAFVQISTLALKSGNGVMLKGGREAIETIRALYETIRDAGHEGGLPDGWIQNMETREEVNEMLALDEYIDLIIPRGSNAFVRYIMDHSRIPVMGHADGICHTYIDRDADIDKAVRIAVDGKTQYPAVCNATETLLVHQDIAKAFLPKFREAIAAKNTELRGDEATQSIIDVKAADEADWKTEYLDYILSIKVVPDEQTAIDHINRYGSGHTDAIVTENSDAAKAFTTGVDSACVFVNASTRFSDGYRFGFGAEVGISTSKLHARGPVGLEGLCTYKYILRGNGDIVADYADGKKHFTHKRLI